MFLQWIWFSMMAASIGYSILTGGTAKVLSSALTGTSEAIQLTIGMGAGYLFFCGLMQIARAAGACGLIERALRPVLSRLLPRTGKAHEAAALNLSMNMLGLGNAATPAGLEAMRQMEEEKKSCPGVRHDMYMLLILNATSIQLLPTTVLTLRMAAGSADPGRIIAPTLLCTAASTLTGTALGLYLRRKGEDKDGR